MIRRLDELEIVAIVIDGMSFKDDEMIIALGVTLEGKKMILGSIEAVTENASVWKDFLAGFLERDLAVEEVSSVLWIAARGSGRQ